MGLIWLLVFLENTDDLKVLFHDYLNKVWLVFSYSISITFFLESKGQESLAHFVERFANRKLVLALHS